MPENNPNKKQQADLNKKILFRLGLALRHYSGLTNQKYKAGVEKGEPTWRIIRYEQILDPNQHYYPIPQNRFVKPYTFRCQMKYLSKHANVIPLQELIDKVEKGEELPLKTVAITFDGGWVDFRENALPVLQRNNIPATLFVATSFMGAMYSYWQDMLMLCMLTLYANEIGLQHVEGLEQFFDDLPPPESPPELLERSVERIGELVDKLKAEHRNKRFETLKLFEQPVEKLGGMHLSRSFLNWEELENIANSPNMKVGSLGHLYDIYTELTAGEISIDIRKSFEEFRAHNIRPIPAFAYPEGLTSKDARKVLKEIGIDQSLALGKFPAPKADGKKPSIYGRIPVFEGNSFCTEFFSNLLWGG